MANWRTFTPPQVENAAEIPRRSGLTPHELMSLAFAGEGRPIVLTDAQRGWRARELWTPEYFAARYPEERLIASDLAPLRLEDNPPQTSLRCTMAEYAAYLDEPAHRLASLEQGAPFYANSWSPFNERPELREHFSFPPSVPDSIANERELEALSNNFTKIFFGPAATVTRLHNDTYYTHAWLSQVRGKKLFVLYAPSDAFAIHAGEGIAAGQGSQQTWFDPLAPDFERFPRARKATAHVAVCDAGETIVVPALWFHYAVSLEHSITLMRNFCNDANADRFMGAWQAARADERAAAPKVPRAPAAPRPPAEYAARRAAARAAGPELGATATREAKRRGASPRRAHLRLCRTATAGHWRRRQ